MEDYYKHKLSAGNLMKCYDIAPLRTKQYFQAEIAYILNKIQPNDKVLELGCGYGRIIPQLAEKARLVIGIDNSKESLLLGQKYTKNVNNCLLLEMNAINLRFIDNSFDLVVCIQNGISAFHVDRKELIRESIQVAKHGGMILDSSYSEKFLGSQA